MAMAMSQQGGKDQGVDHQATVTEAAMEPGDRIEVLTGMTIIEDQTDSKGIG